MIKTFVTITLAGILTALCAGCAGINSNSASDSSGITMYGTIDQGISYTNK